MKFRGKQTNQQNILEIDKLNVFFSQNIFRQYPTNRKKVMTGFRYGSKGGHRKG